MTWCVCARAGPKVADCVALFSCDARDVVPVDTHVWAIACRHYDPDGTLRGSKSLTRRVYESVGDRFRHRFGAAAGWAHSWLFAAELPQFRDRLPAGLVDDIAAAVAEERAAKRAAAEAKRAAKRSKAAGEDEGGGGGSASGGESSEGGAEGS